MTYERKDFKERLAEKAAARRNDTIPAARALQPAGVIMAKLTTGSDEWNRYLSYVQGQINKTRDQRAAAQQKMADPTVWEPYQLTKLKSDIIQADAMISAWEWAMALPKALVDGGAEATEFLNKLDRENDKAAQPPES